MLTFLQIGAILYVMRGQERANRLPSEKNSFFSLCRVARNGGSASLLRMFCMAWI